MLQSYGQLHLNSQNPTVEVNICAAECFKCCVAADGQSGRAALAAYAARRWLARNAGGVKLVRTPTSMEALGWIGLVSCLPALQDVTLTLTRPLKTDDLGCLLEALARCPRLRALDLSTGQERMNAIEDLDLY